MINKREIMSQALELNLPPNTVEKDYVLNWVLAGIANQAELNNTWIFKGGTCLKKCFFETYRFSEDLDFTLLNKQHLNDDFLHKQFRDISSWIYENSGVELLESHFQFEAYENPRGNLSVEGSVAYRGPMQRKGSTPRIKLDLTNDEKIVLKPESRKIYHPYSDDLESSKISAYCLEEIFAEKLRALAERLRPRDLYDVIHLHQDQRWTPNREKFIKSLREKCQFKNIEMPSFQSISTMPEKAELITEWDNMLGHQIGDLPPFQHYWDQLPEVLEWVEGG